MACSFSRFTVSRPLVNGLKIHTLASPQAEPSSAPSIVLVHGLGLSAAYMAPTAERLARFCNVFVLDLPGFGGSDRPPRALDLPELADMLAQWLAAVGLKRASFLGNSLGCQVIVDLASRYPALTDRLILVGPTVDVVGRTFLRQLWRGIRVLLREPWSLWPIVARDFLSTGIARLLRTAHFALADPVERKFPLVQAPTLVVRGERDALVPQRWAEEVAGLLPAGQLAVIPGGTHATNYSAPAALSHVTAAFMTPAMAHGPREAD